MTSYNWADRRNNKARLQQQPRPLLAPLDPGAVPEYAAAALAGEVANVAAAVEGRRNDTLNIAAFKLGQLVGSGHLDHGVVWDALENAALSTGLNLSGIRGTLRSGLGAGVKLPRQVELRPEFTPVVDEVSMEELTASPDFWKATLALEHIRQFALARMVSPWAVLGVCMLRAIAVTPPHVVLPALIGGYGSLNLFCALVGPSGVGKGAAEATAIDCIDMLSDVYTAPVGSGEGIAHQYAHRERTEIVRDRDSVLFIVSEVDTLTSLGQRQGSTLLSQLRSAFSGERLGFGYADAVKRLPIDRHSYRLAMSVGVQPEKAGPLLADADGGTPQRFIWLPATDRDIVADPEPEPPQWVLEQTTHWARDDRAGGYHVLGVPEGARRTIRENHAHRARGEGEALDGHSLFARAKVAQALTLLDGRRVMTDRDWELSGTVMTVSDLTRAKVAATLQQAAARANTSKALQEARRTVLISETVEDAAIKRVCSALLRVVPETGQITGRDLRHAINSRDRQFYDEALERLSSTGTLRVEIAGIKQLISRQFGAS